MSEDKHQQRMQEKYKLEMQEFKEDNKKSICFINLFSTIATVALAIGTIWILNLETNSCDHSYLRLTLWLMLGMHATNIIEAVCNLTGLATIFCGCCCVIGFFVYEIAVLVYMNSVFYTSGECRDETPKQYWWLLTNIIVYFAFLGIACVFHLRSIFGSPSKKEVEEELTKEEEGDTRNSMH